MFSLVLMCMGSYEFVLGKAKCEQILTMMWKKIITESMVGRATNPSLRVQQRWVWGTRWVNQQRYVDDPEERVGGANADEETGSPQTSSAGRSDPIGEEMRVDTFVRDEVKGRDDEDSLTARLREKTGEAVYSATKKVEDAAASLKKDDNGGVVDSVGQAVESAARTVRKSTAPPKGHIGGGTQNMTD